MCVSRKRYFGQDSTFVAECLTYQVGNICLRVSRKTLFLKFDCIWDLVIIYQYNVAKKNPDIAVPRIADCYLTAKRHIVIANTHTYIHTHIRDIELRLTT